MAARGRRPAQQPATVYDYRRMKALVDVLAMDNPTPSILSLCETWGIKQVKVEDAHMGEVWSIEQTIFALARHVLEHGRDEADGSAR